MPSKQSGGEAGAYASQRYKRGLRRWRRRIRTRLLLVLAPFVLPALYLEYTDPHLWHWLGGVMMGMALGLWAWVRDTPPPYVEAWQRGHEGETKTAAELARLPGSWRVFHDIQTGRGNYDHIAVGPAGVFLLESKNPRGRLVVHDGRPQLTFALDDERVWDFGAAAGQAIASARELRGYIRDTTRFTQFVQAVVVVWCDFPAGVHRLDSCTFVHGKELRAWLEAQPATIADMHVDRCADAIGALTRGATARAA